MLHASVHKLIHRSFHRPPTEEEASNNVEIKSEVPQEYLQRFGGSKLHFKCFYDLTWTLMQAGV